MIAKSANKKRKDRSFISQHSEKIHFVVSQSEKTAFCLTQKRKAHYGFTKSEKITTDLPKAKR